MAKQKLHKNILPLLAVTALLLSVSLASYNDSVLLGNKSTQSVLSESDENKEEDEKKSEEKGEKRENKERERTEVRSVESEKRVEATRKPEPKVNRAKIEVKEELKVENENRNRNEEQEKNENEVEDEDNNEQEMESEFEQETETVSADGVTTRYKLKVKSKIVNGKTFVETAAGEVEVENSPEDAVNELIADGVIDTPVEFDVKTENDKVEFEFKGIEAKKLLGLFNVNLPKTVTVDADSGEVTQTNRSLWNSLLNLLSI